MSSLVEQAAKADIDRAVGRWRGSGWSRRSRTTFAVLYLLITIPAFAGTDVPAKGVISWIVLSCLVAATYEWRAQKMGVEISCEGIALIRPLNTTRLAWSEIDAFFTRDAGLWGDKTIHVHRRQAIGMRVPPRIGLQLPTAAIVNQNKPMGRWSPVCDLVCGELRVPQDEVLDFLNGLITRFKPPPAA